MIVLENQCFAHIQKDTINRKGSKTVIAEYKMHAYTPHRRYILEQIHTHAALAAVGWKPI